jgi:hypothetical protein
MTQMYVWMDFKESFKLQPFTYLLLTHHVCAGVCISACASSFKGLGLERIMIYYSDDEMTEDWKGVHVSKSYS